MTDRRTDQGYQWDAYYFGQEATVDIDISGDDAGWSGCAHPSEITLSRATLEAMLSALDEEVAEWLRRNER